MSNTEKKMNRLLSARSRLIVALVGSGWRCCARCCVFGFIVEAITVIVLPRYLGSPSIESLPGAGDPTSEYVKSQNSQNQKNEAKARAKGTTSVPTMTRPSFIGNPDAFGTLPSTAATDKTSDVGKPDCPLKKTSGYV